MWPLLKAIPLRLYIYAGIAAFIGILLWHDNHLSKLYKAQKAATEQVEASLEQERANRKIERNDRKLADEIVQPVEVKVARIATRPDPVGVYCRPAKLPRASSQSGSSTSTSSPPVDRGSETPLRDIGSALGAVRREAETNNARHEGLIEFEKRRTH